MIISIDSEVYNNLSDSEKRIADYINTNEDRLINLSLSAIAQETFTSITSVSRCIEKCGFNGIHDLRYTIKNNSSKENPDPYVVNGILAKSFRECIMTIDAMKIPDILEIIQYINQAKTVYIFARGFTSLVAEEFEMQLQLLGYDVRFVQDVTWLVKTDRILCAEDVAIYISVKATTPELATSAKLAKRKGAKVIVCICKEGTSLEKYADITLHGHAETIVDHSKSLIEVTSRIPLTIMCRTIVEYLNL